MRQRWWRRFVMVGMWALLAGCVGPVPGPATRMPAKPGPIADLAESVQAITSDNFKLELHLEGLLERPAKAKAGTPARLELMVSGSRLDGQWGEGSGASPALGQKSMAVDLSGLVAEARTLRGVVRLGWPTSADQPARPAIEVRIEAAVGVPVRPMEEMPDIRAERFWVIYPGSQGDLRAVEGTYQAVMEGQPVSGRVVGRQSLPVRPGKWNMGTQAGGGVHLGFDLGATRQNWNFARLALMQLPQPQDWSECGGVRLVIESDVPREDAEVSLWAREADGSWYYVRSVCPLVDIINEATVRWEDFAEAEWVAPDGQHMDEDYAFDRREVTHVALGVVNPLGVGKVGFTVRSMELVGPGLASTALPAVVRVSGKTLAVNDHDKVPSGIFGGYAGEMPQEFRPGCQRQLNGPVTMNVPRQRFAQFNGTSFTDWARLLEAIRSPSPAAPKLSPHLLSLLEPRQRLSIERFDPARYVPRRASEAAPGELVGAMNRMLRSRELFEAAAFEGVALPAELTAELSRREGMDGTQMMEANRRLLEATFAGLIRPRIARGPAEQFMIDCWFDRYSTATLLQRADWKEAFESWGRSYGQMAAEAGYEAVLEFWNEPYLNWATRPGRNYDVRMFKVEEAVEGGEVRVLYRMAEVDANGEAIRGQYRTRDGPVIPHFRWRKSGEGWRVVDETQFTYWSGRGNGWVYDQMLGALGPALKAANPKARLIAGWGFRWNEDHWAGWEMLYKPTIDRNIQWIDGIHEHHYQGDTTAMNGSYELLSAYAQTRYGKWLYSLNTETNDLVDAPARGIVDTPAKAKAASNYRKMVYNLRDCVYSVLQSPDKLLARTVIHNDAEGERDNPKGWTRAAYGLMADLRGRLIETESADPSVWCVASVDGTDPASMPLDPAQNDEALVVVVFNDHRQEREVEVVIELPTGTRFRSAATQQTHVDAADFSIGLKPGVLPVGDGRAMKVALKMPARSAWKVRLPLEGGIVAARQVVRRQFFSPDVLQRVRRGEATSTTVKVDPAAIATARRAWVRLVVESVSEGEGTVAVAGHRMALPRAMTADNGNRIVELPIDVSWLSGEVPVVFSVNGGNHAGYLVPVTSVVLEQREP